MNKDRDEYYVLTEKLEEITWALEGKCNDIDCDRYMYQPYQKLRLLMIRHQTVPNLRKAKDCELDEGQN